MNKKYLTDNRLSPTTIFTPVQHALQNTGLARKALSLCLMVIVVTLAACSSAGTPTPTTAAPATLAPQPTAVPTQVIVPTSANVSQQRTITTALDPCQLITSDEGSKLTGVSFGPGTEHTISGDIKSCTYSSHGTNSLVVEVAQAPDINTAKQDQADFLSELQADAQKTADIGLVTTQVPNFADEAIQATGSVSANGLSVSGIAFGFRKGTIFFGFSDTAIGGTAPTSAAMQAEAQAVLNQLP
jgi:hypothetical protein